MREIAYSPKVILIGEQPLLVELCPVFLLRRNLNTRMFSEGNNPGRDLNFIGDIRGDVLRARTKF